jgi:DNA helicase HerA-like ATPase
MPAPQPLPIAKSSHELCLLPGLANRHGLITGATGTGKTVTLQTMAEAFSSIGVPVFMADVKGDLAGLSQAGSMNPKLKERVDKLALGNFAFAGCPTVFWDVYGALGSEVGRQIIRGVLGSILGDSSRRR